MKIIIIFSYELKFEPEMRTKNGSCQEEDIINKSSSSSNNNNDHEYENLNLTHRMVSVEKKLIKANSLCQRCLENCKLINFNRIILDKTVQKYTLKGVSKLLI